MPNWTENELVIEGEENKVAACLEAIKGENGAMDFNKIIPMPTILINIGKGFRTIDGIKVSNWFEDSSLSPTSKERSESIRLLNDEEKAELEKIGYSDWYDWSVAKWGVKWNASDADVDDCGCGMAYVRFNTPWDAPYPVIEALRKQWPDLQFTLNFRHEGESPYPHTF